MSAWLLVLPVALLVPVGLWLAAPRPRRGWALAASAAMLGLAGYAWQGRPDLAAAPAAARPVDRGAVETLLRLRGDMTPRFTPGAVWLRLADAAGTRGDHAEAAAILRGAIRRSPRDGDLWAALGVQTLMAADMRTTPAASLAMGRAREYALGSPVPDYFEAIAALRGGDAEAALAGLDRVLAKGGAKAEWRPLVTAQRDALRAALAPPSPTPGSPPPTGSR